MAGRQEEEALILCKSSNGSFKEKGLRKWVGDHQIDQGVGFVEREGILGSEKGTLLGREREGLGAQCTQEGVAGNRDGLTGLDC